VMKALEKDRTRRYETASTFAADVRRFLAEEPIEARPPSTVYKLKKFVRRNRVAVLTAGAMAAALLAGTALATWQAVRATRAEARARLEEASATAERDRAEDAERLANARLEEVTKAKQQADEEASIVKALNDFTIERIIGEVRAASEGVTKIVGEIVDGKTAKSKRAEFVASFRRLRRANDMVRALAEKWKNLPPRQVGPEDEAVFKTMFKSEADTAQVMAKLVPLAQKYPAEISAILDEAMQDEPKKK
jgi:hypothetical protein